MTEKPPEKKYLRLSVDVQDFVGLILALIGTLILTLEWPGPPTFGIVDYAGIALVVLGFLVFLFGGWVKLKWT